MDDARFRQLNELKVGIETSDILVEVDWFHVIRSNDFCNLKWHMHPSVEMHCVLEGEDDFCLPDETVAEALHYAIFSGIWERKLML